MIALVDYKIDRSINLWNIRMHQPVKITDKIIQDFIIAIDENQETDDEIKAKYGGVYYAI